MRVPTHPRRASTRKPIVATHAHPLPVPLSTWATEADAVPTVGEPSPELELPADTGAGPAFSAPAVPVGCGTDVWAAPGAFGRRGRGGRLRWSRGRDRGTDRLPVANSDSRRLGGHFSPAGYPLQKSRSDHEPRRGLETRVARRQRQHGSGVVSRTAVSLGSTTHWRTTS